MRSIVALFVCLAACSHEHLDFAPHHGADGGLDRGLGHGIDGSLGEAGPGCLATGACLDASSLNGALSAALLPAGSSKQAGGADSGAARASTPGADSSASNQNSSADTNPNGYPTPPGFRGLLGATRCRAPACRAFRSCAAPTSTRTATALSTSSRASAFRASAFAGKASTSVTRLPTRSCARDAKRMCRPLAATGLWALAKSATRPLRAKRQASRARSTVIGRSSCVVCLAACLERTSATP